MHESIGVLISDPSSSVITLALCMLGQLGLFWYIMQVRMWIKTSMAAIKNHLRGIHF